MKRSLFLVAFLSMISGAFAQLNITQLSNLTYNEDLSDVWGWHDGNGKEYALVGAHNGFSVVDITDPANPNEIHYEAGKSSIWRDIKTWNNYAYVTTEGGGGLLIIDLSVLPIDTLATYYTGTNYPFQSAHNLYIDENGIAYIFGSNYSEGGAIMLDLTQDPMAPVEVGLFDTYYVHDGVVRGDTLWASCINDGIQTAIDVSNKANPVLMASWATPSDFAHNCWISDDGKYLFTTDEKEYAYIGAYDVSNLSNVVEVDRWQSNPGSGVIPHNVHFMNDYIITSYYNDGITINDVSDPSIMVEVGNFDTSPDYAGNDAGGFHGAWGAYPWLPSGIILAADIENGLFVLQPTYTRASYLKGTVMEEGTSNIIGNAQVEIIGYGVVDQTDVTGNYGTGIPESGTYKVVYSALGFISDTVTINFSTGNTVIYNALLASKPKTNIRGEVKNGSWVNVPESQVKFKNDELDFEKKTDTNGNFTIDNIYLNTYSVIAGSWGYKTTIENNKDISGDDYVIAFVEDGYYDDFTFDFGWTVSGSATAGIWTRAIPLATNYQGNGANPDIDVTDDIDDFAFVTGNGSSDVSVDDVDNGSTILTSPIMDLSKYADPYAKFYTWFYNGGGSGNLNDTLYVSINNGIETVNLLKITFATPMSQWVNHNIKLTDYITITNNMKLIVEAIDRPGGHIVEAGFDMFRITEGPSAINTVEDKDDISFYPNPTTGALKVLVAQKSNVIITDITGKVVLQQTIDAVNNNINFSGETGVYFMSIVQDGKIISTQKVIKL